MGDNPLIGVNDDKLGPRFPDMIEPYAREYVELAEAVASRKASARHRGVYVAAHRPISRPAPSTASSA